MRLTIQLTLVRSMGCVVALLGGMMLLNGCTSSGASDWAQTSPVLRAEPAEVQIMRADADTATINLGTRDG